MRILSSIQSSFRMPWFAAKCFAIATIFLACSNFVKAQSITESALPSVITGNFTISLSVTEVPREVDLIFTNITGASADSGEVWTLVSPRSNSINPSFLIQPLNLGNSTSSYYALPNNIPMPDGKYTVTSQFYRTSNGALVKSLVTRTFTLDERTIAPQIISPLSNTYLKNNFVFQSNSEEPILAGSKKLQFIKGVDTTTVLLKNQTDTIAFNTNDLAGSSLFDITSGTPDNLAEGTYKIILSDQDVYGHAVANDTIFNVTIDTTTISAPSIISPSSSAVIKTNFAATFNLPVTAALNSVKLVFQKGAESDTLVVSDTSAGNNTVTINPNYLMASTNAVSSNAFSLSNGQYVFKLFFNDLLGNNDSTQSTLTLQTDSVTLTPVLTAPANNATDISVSTITFTLPEPALANSVQIQFMGCNDDTVTLDATTAGSHTYSLNGVDLASSAGVVSASSNPLFSGTYAVSLSYQDSSGNPRAYVLNSHYSFTNTVLGLNFDMLKGYLQTAKTHLQWETVTENDLAYFEVQYSKDAKTFSDIGKVNAVGTSYTKRDYNFINNAEPLAVNYYRLRMVNDDGTFTYSPVIAVYENNTTEEFKVYPNPATEKLNVTITSGNPAETHTLKVWGMDGKLVKTIPVQTGIGSNLFSFPIDDLNAGNYVLQDGDNITMFAKMQ